MEVTTVGVDGADVPGTVVGLDVVRAFTTAAAAFAAGAADITTVEHLHEARALRLEVPGCLLLGEERGLRPDGFDHGNETTAFDGVDLSGRRLVQRTSNGTRGLAAARRADHLLAGAAVTAGATAAWILRCAPQHPVTLVTTGPTDEDLALADHLTALLRGGRPRREHLAERVRASLSDHTRGWTRPRDDPERARFAADVDRCADVDRHPFTMVAARTSGPGRHPVLRAVRPDGNPWTA